MQEREDPETPSVGRKPRRRAAGGTSPTQRSLQVLRERGLEADVTERWIPQARKRKDLFGWIDILAMDKVTGQIHGVQTTTTRAAERVEKIRAWERLDAWKRGGHRAIVHSWVKRNDRQKGRRKVWTLREIEV